MTAGANAEACVITGAALHIPGVEAALNLLDASPVRDTPFEPKAILGRKGLFGKDRATLLALCAAKSAFEQARWPENGIDPARVGVVVSSNFGNLDTVERVRDIVGKGGSAAASMMDAPNASSNVIASTLAIRFGCKGPNYTICSGGTSSIDAMRVAKLTMQAGRADAMLVVGVEPCNAVVKHFVEPHLPTSAPGRARLADGAAALIVERASGPAARGVPGLLRIGAVSRVANNADPAPLVIPNTSRLVSFGRKRADASCDTQHIDVEARLGACHGLLAIVQAVLACALVRTSDASVSLYALLQADAPYETDSATAILEPLTEGF
jgi:3-oxoacyl-[acyl-carrier-protein] synthase II